MPVVTQTIDELLLADGDGRHEVHGGVPVTKPLMSFGHNETASKLAHQLIHQLDDTRVRVFQNRGHLRVREGETYVPDVTVLPVSMFARYRGQPRSFEVYDDPVPFVAEVWSPKTGGYDVETKVPEYRNRNDEEVWRVHPFQRTVTIWSRVGPSQYENVLVTSGIVQLHALPAAIDLERLFLDANDWE